MTPGGRVAQSLYPSLSVLLAQKSSHIFTSCETAETRFATLIWFIKKFCWLYFAEKVMVLIIFVPVSSQPLVLNSKTGIEWLQGALVKSSSEWNSLAQLYLALDFLGLISKVSKPLKNNSSSSNMNLFCAFSMTFYYMLSILSVKQDLSKPTYPGSLP